MRPIKLSQKDKNDLLQDFSNYLDSLRTSSNTIHYSSNLTSAKTNLDEPIKLYISADAYVKMLLYVRDTQTEIGWHGTVMHTEDRKSYWITDVMVYPQTVTGATVNTDQEEYEKWLEALPDDTFNHLRFQGHSHVNMATSPSGVDERYYEDMIQPLANNGYYIFLIMNKSGDTMWRIYDLKTNQIYENGDISVMVLSSGAEKVDLITTTVNEKLAHLKTPVYKAPASSYYSSLSGVSVKQSSKTKEYDYWKEVEEMDAYYERALRGDWDEPKKKGKKK